MNRRLLISGGPLFDGNLLHENGAVLIEEGVVRCVFNTPVNIENVESVDTEGQLIMPGLVDLHSDSLERNIEKRKGVFFDTGFALLNLDRQLAASGITTFCHAISFADKELGLRSPDEAEKCVRTISAFDRSGQALIKHKIHIRYEVGSENGLMKIKALLREGLVDMVSIMDHTPGQGQFRSMESYIRFHSMEYALSAEEIITKATEKQEQNDRAWKMVLELVRSVREAGIPVLSHDDDTEEKVQMVREMGGGASEFPVTLNAARTAFESGMKVYMGAPNLLRDLSTNGNLKTSEAIREGLCTGLMSDYYPESLFQASFIAAKMTNSLEAGLALATSGPGSFFPDNGRRPGFIVPGADADILIVDRAFEWAHVTQVFVKGEFVFKTEKNGGSLNERRTEDYENIQSDEDLSGRDDSYREDLAGCF